MSIAELIMTGTERASKSTDWVADSLVKIGENVGKVLREREQQKQAQEMLPFLQQSMQESMKLAGQGQSGEAYSRMIGMLTPETLNNPQSMTLVKLGLDAIGKSTDDYLLSQKATQSTSGMDSILPILALTNPQLASQLTAARTQAGNQPAVVTQPTNIMGAGGTTVADFDTPVSELPTGQGSAPQDTGLMAPVGTPQEGGQQSPSPTQAVYAQRQTDINKAVESGVPFSAIMAESTKMIWDKDSIKPFAKSFKSISGLDRYIPGAEGVAILESPDQLKQKGMNISSKGGVSLSFENIDPLYDYQAAKEPFNKSVSDSVAILNADNDLQKAIKKLGGFENISFSTRRGKNYIEYQEDGKNKGIEVKDATRKATEFMLGVAQGAKDAMMPLYGTEIDMPPVGGGRGVQTNVTPKIANAMAQAQRELPNAGKDQIIARARDIAAGAK